MQLSEVFDFQRQFCAYYRVLEDDFCATEKYLTVNPDNYSAYSNEFIKQIQTICSEIEVTLKVLCKVIDPKFKGEHFPQYCKCILDHIPLFGRANVSYIRVQDLMLAPWLDWSYSMPPSNKPKAKLESNNPEWWTVHNKIKHDRTALNPQTQVPYYKYANQGNVLNALAALFIVNSCILNIACKDLPKDSSMHFLSSWYNSSKMFSSFVVAGL